MKLSFTGFLGSSLAVDPLRLPEGVGVFSVNQMPDGFALRPWAAAASVANVPTSTQRKTIYRMGRDVAAEANYWLSWSTVVHAIRGFDPDDSLERTYYTGDGGPKWTDNVQALTGGAPYPQSSRILGVPAPLSAPTLTILSAGASTTVEDRYYVSTFGNDIGWESAPSPPAKITCNEDATITISSLEAAPSGNYGITWRRIYRTQTGATGATEFQFLREIAIGTTTTVDDGRDLGDVLVTQGPDATDPLDAWVPLPDNAKWLTKLWNQMAAAIVGKTVRFCAANYIYAWPRSYSVQLSDTPMALVKFGQTLIVLTSGQPSEVTGQDPTSMRESPIGTLPFNASCVSDVSAVSMSHGACWAGPDGLCYIGASGSAVVTRGLLKPEQWRALKPETMVGCQYRGLYFGFYKPAGTWLGFCIDPLNPTGIYWMDKGYQAAWFDEYTGNMYVLDTDGSVKKFNGGPGNLTASHTSREQITPSCCFAYARVIARSYPVTLSLVADGVTVDTATVTSDDSFALPGDYEAQRWQVVASTNGQDLIEVLVAESTEELFE